MKRSTEMQTALRSVGRLPENCLLQNPAGSWSFVGRVDSRLAYVRKDGQPMDDETAYIIRQFGPGLAGVKCMSWPTRAAAILEAESLGITVHAPTA